MVACCMAGQRIEYYLLYRHCYIVIIIMVSIDTVIYCIVMVNIIDSVTVM